MEVEVESGDVSEVVSGGEQLLVSEDDMASGAVSISPTDMDGNAVTLTNATEQVRATTLTLTHLHPCPDVIEPERFLCLLCLLYSLGPTFGELETEQTS